MKKPQIINYKGLDIYYLDFSNLKKANEIGAIINEGKLFIRSKPPKSVITLSNIESMHFNSEIKDLFVDFVKGNKEFMKASAITGVSGLRQIVFNGIMKLTGRDIRSFENPEQAKEWLWTRNHFN